MSYTVPTVADDPANTMPSYLRTAPQKLESDNYFNNARKPPIVTSSQNLREKTQCFPILATRTLTIEEEAHFS